MDRTLQNRQERFAGSGGLKVWHKVGVTGRHPEMAQTGAGIPNQRGDNPKDLAADWSG